MLSLRWASFASRPGLPTALPGRPALPPMDQWRAPPEPGIDDDVTATATAATQGCWTAPLSTSGWAINTISAVPGLHLRIASAYSVQARTWAACSLQALSRILRPQPLELTSREMPSPPSLKASQMTFICVDMLCGRADSNDAITSYFRTVLSFWSETSQRGKGGPSAQGGFAPSSNESLGTNPNDLPLLHRNFALVNGG